MENDCLSRRIQIAIAKLERAKGIEPSCAVWKTAVLPLNYARLRWTAVRPAATGSAKSSPSEPQRKETAQNAGADTAQIISRVLALSIRRR
jgi:hypothetical protein